MVHEKRDKHVTLRVESTTHARIQAARSAEDLTVSVFMRKLTRWAMQHYEQHGCLWKLFKNLPAPRLPKRKPLGRSRRGRNS
jgi:hypothetical protein